MVKMPSKGRLVAALKSNVDLLIAAKAIALVEGERINAIHREILEAGEYYESHKMAAHRDNAEPKRIVDPGKSWEMDEDDFSLYMVRVAKAIHAAGYEVKEFGLCPKLIAESELRDAEHALILASREFFPEITINGLLCGTDEKSGLEMYREYVDLLCKLVVSAVPGKYENDIMARVIDRKLGEFS